MAILAWGTSTTEVVTSTSLPAGISTVTNAALIGAYVSEGFSVDSDAAGVLPKLTLSTPDSEIWFGTNFYEETSYSSSNVPLVFYGGTTALFRLYTSTSTTWRMEYWNGSAWTAAFTAVTCPVASSIHRLDIRLKMDNAVGAIELYVGGVLQASYAGDTIYTAETTISSVVVGYAHATNSIQTTWSACFVSDEDSRQILYTQRAVNGAGAATDWTGAFTTIDETGFDDTDLLQSSTNGHVSTFAKAALPTALNTGYDVIGVGVTARARKGASGPANLQLVSRSGAVNGVSASKALGVTFTPYQEMFPLDPNTAAVWTYANADSSQLGVKAIT